MVNKMAENKKIKKRIKMKMKKNIHVVAARKNQKNNKIMLGFFVIYF